MRKRKEKIYQNYFQQRIIRITALKSLATKFAPTDTSLIIRSCLKKMLRSYVDLYARTFRPLANKDQE